MANDRPAPVLKSLIRSEAAGGLLLIASATVALIVANSGSSELYFDALHTVLGPMSVEHWVNDALMALFFLLVGLEVKREFTEGRLATWPARRLPIIAAAAGMIVPAGVYIAMIGAAPELLRGWAIPAATDIAFALAILLLVGSRAPPSLKLLLTTIAVVDDVLAVTIIAFAYTETLNFVALAAAGLILLLMFGLNKAGEQRLSPYAALAVALWVAVYLSGIHATLAGVLAAAAIPVQRDAAKRRAAASPLDRMEHALQPWVAFAVLPLFGFANAGVSLAGLTIDDLFSPLAVAIAASLIVGKQLGVFASIRIAVALGLGKLPRGATWPQVYGLAVLSGIGFTMSLFIGDLAFDDPLLNDQVKIGVLAGSCVSALVGYCILRLAPVRTSLKS